MSVGKRTPLNIPITISKGVGICLLFVFLFKKAPPLHKSDRSSSSSWLRAQNPQVQRSDIETGRSSFSNEIDPNLSEMKFTLPGDEKEHTFMAYKVPDVSTFYKEDFDNGILRRKISPSFRGMAGKFINMSPYKMVLYW